MIIGIVAVSEDWGIGKSNGLLFSLKEDMRHFRDTTMGNTVVCGENTLLSLPNSRPLKRRSTIVLCPEGHEYDDCICVHDFGKLVKMLKVLSITNDIYVIGGGMLYRSMLPYYDEVNVTKVHATDPETTVFFPNLDEDPNFFLREESVSPELIDNGYTIQFMTYERKGSRKQW